MKSVRGNGSSWNSQSLNFGGNSADLVIPEEDPNMSNSSHSNGFYDSKSIKRRSSIDGKSEMSDSVFPLGNRLNGGSNVLFEDGVKENVFSNIHRSESCLIENKHDSGDKNSNQFFMAKGKLQSKS